MYKRFSLYISLIIISGVCLAVLSVIGFSNMTWVSYQESYQRLKEEQFHYYIDTIIQNHSDAISSHAIWSEAVEKVKDSDSEWLANNVSTYIVDMGLLSVDYIMLADEKLDFTQESGGSYFDEILSMSQVQDALYMDVPMTYFSPLGEEYVIITASPFFDDDGENPYGLYVLMTIFDEARASELFGIMGSELTGYKIIEDTVTIDSSYDVETQANNFTNILIDVPDSKFLVQFDFDLSETYETFRRGRNYTIFMILVSASFVGIFLIVFLRTVTKKIKGITNNVIKISEGNYDMDHILGESKFLHEMNFLSRAVIKMSRDIKKHIQTIDKNYLEMVEVIISAVEINDAYTSRHNIEVGTYAQIISEELNYDGIDNIILAAKLHDIGKISIPSHILNKPGRLTDEEYEIIKTHPTEGYKIIDNIEYFNEIKHGVKYHHEHWDGSGYPDGLKGDEIPLMAQIISLADVYDAMTSDRSYRKGISHAATTDYIINESGRLFNPIIVDAFIKRQDDFNIYLESIRHER